MVIKISKKSNKRETRKAMEKLSAARKKKSPSLNQFYGALKGMFGNALEYQKQMRDEWK